MEQSTSLESREERPTVTRIAYARRLIKEARKGRYSQEDLSHEFRNAGGDATTQTILRWERGENYPPVNKHEVLKRVLQEHLDELGIDYSMQGPYWVYGDDGDPAPGPF